MTLPRASTVAPHSHDPVDTVVLDYDGRLLRRKKLTARSGFAFLVDLPAVTHLEPGQAFTLEDGRTVAIAAADEALIEVRGDLPRFAWHIGNRHTPCEILPDSLVIREDKVLRAMLEQLGATVETRTGPFRPEGGAYGHGRTMGHSHD